MLNILITGANGQLGRSLQRLGCVSPHNYICTDVAELDITDAGAVLRAVREQGIDVIVNCAAYTDVERAEEDEARADLLNHKAAAYLAAAAKETGATLIHVSTDYVFDGTAHTPYTEETCGRTRRHVLGLPVSDLPHGVALFGIREELPEDDAAADLGAGAAAGGLRPDRHADLRRGLGAGDLLDHRSGALCGQ